jgi:hypothetical protein
VLADLRRFIGNRLVDFHREYLQVEKERMWGKEERMNEWITPFFVPR